MKAISTLFLPMLETEVRHTDLWLSRHATDPLETGYHMKLSPFLW